MIFILFVITVTVLIGLFNCFIFKKIEKKYGNSFINNKNGELISMFDKSSPVVAKIFIALQFIPLINMFFTLLIIIDVITGNF